MSIPPVEILSLRAALCSREVTATELLDQVLSRIAEWDDPAIWISQSSVGTVRDRARELDAMALTDPGVVERMPLFAIPFAVKDNIDVAGYADNGRLPRLRLHAGASRRRWSSGCSPRAQCSSARPISTNSRPGWSVRGRPMARQGTRSTAVSSPAVRVRARPWRSRRAWSLCPRH